MSLSQDLRLSFVPRWAIVPMLRSQSVADHSWRVAMIARELALATLPEERRSTVWMIATRALLHDLDEAKTGDIPSTNKPTPDFKAMASEDLLVKVADYLEGYTWAYLFVHPKFKQKVLGHINGRLSEAMMILETQWPGVSSVVNSIKVELTGDPV